MSAATPSSLANLDDYGNNPSSSSQSYGHTNTQQLRTAAAVAHLSSLGGGDSTVRNEEAFPSLFPPSHAHQSNDEQLPEAIPPQF
eukprot:2548904-Pleurochrysis_carterae.AAC.1